MESLSPFTADPAAPDTGPPGPSGSSGLSRSPEPTETDRPAGPDRPPGPDSAAEVSPAWRRLAVRLGRLAGRPAVAVPGCYLIAAYVLTWRLWVDPASHTVAGNWTDADLFAWYLRYAALAVSHGRLPALVTSALNAPQGVNMMWNTSLFLPGVVLAPVTLLLGPQVSLTILMTAGFTGSAAALFFVLRRWQVSDGAAALAGAVYGFSPAIVQSAVGHYDLQFAVLPPLIIDAGLALAVGRAAVRPAGAPLAAGWTRRVPAAVRHGAWLGLLLAAQVFISEEIALLTVLTGVLLVTGLAAASPLTAVRRAGPLLAGLAVAGAVTLALAWHALATQLDGPLAQHGALFPPDYYVNDLTSFVTPSAFPLFHTAATAATAARYQGGLTEYLAYLGWPLIAVLAAAAVLTWRRPIGRAVTLTLAFLVVFSLGGHPLVGGTTNPAVDLPWHWLEEHPLLSSVLPDRLSILADGVAAVLLALAIDAARVRLAARGHRSRRAGRWPGLVLADAVLVVAVLACLPLVPRPLPAASATPLPAGWSAAIAGLRLPAGARVLVVPVPTNILTVAMRWQADTGEPPELAGGYFIGPGATGQAYIGGNGVRPTAWYLDRLWAAGLPESDPLASVAWAAGLPTSGPAGIPSAGMPPTSAELRADLGFWRPDAIVAVTAAQSPVARYLIALFGRPTVRAGRVLGWRLPGTGSRASGAGF